MKTFNVLEPTLNIHQSLLLEASAGTGKTYSIENIVLRAIREDPCLSIKDILVVTFTKAAAKDLRLRILANLQKQPSHPRVKRALIEFDLANISTIHAFCYRALAENATTYRLNQQPEDLSQKIQWHAAEKYFRTALTNDVFTPAQLNTLLRPHQNDISTLAQSLIKTQAKGIHFAPPESNEVLLHKIEKALQEIGYTPKQLLEACETYAYHFYGLCEGKTKILKKEYYKTLSSFEPSEELLEILSLYAHVKKTMSRPPLSVFNDIQEKIVPLLRAFASYESLFIRLSAGFQKVLFQEYEEAEICDFSYLLVKMHKLIQEDFEFKERLKSKYRMVIIDEFQDTDPLQWKIFNELFSASALILVGDPKQSIYAFRNADIYTYLNAAQQMDSQYLLNTNYRSTPELINALNYLFEAAPGWIALPYLNTHLPYRPVQAKGPIASQNVALHFIFAAGPHLKQVEEMLFPQFLQEVRVLQREGIPLSGIAFLVRDQFQGERLFRYFQTKRVPALQKRALTIENAEILQDLIHLLRAIKAPRQIGLVQVALGTQFFRWTANDLERLKDQTLLAKILHHFHTWHQLWEKEGIGCAIEALLSTPFEGKPIQEILLASLEGMNRYHELRQILEWLIGKEEDPLLLLEETLEYPLRPLVDQDAVQILTLHMSKGLEFEAVFALGVINRPPLDRGMILVRQNETKVLKAASPQEHEDFLEENDAEKMRQLYVALTRAKTALYIPFVEGWKPPSLGSASPLELLLARIGEPLSDWKGLYKKLESSRRPILNALIEKCPHIGWLQGNTEEPCFLKATLPTLIPPSPISLYFPKQINTSFTSLAKTTKNILQAPYDFNSEIKTAHTLPAGAHTGDLLHQLLEEIPFSIDVQPFIRRYLVNTPFEAWEEVIGTIISQSLHFLHIDEEACFREMEFTYPLELAHFLPECRPLRGMMRGVIDLFFIREGKYYLLDWKSNWLGPDDTAYNEANMRKAMQENAYDLQAALYQIAIREYLAKVDPRPFEEIFGGVIYFFLRGNTYVLYK